MKLVVVESPYAGNVPANVEYARRCMAACLRRGWSPYASHLLYTQDGVLDDDDPEERRLGIKAGFAWGEVACFRAVFVDRGITAGMVKGIEAAGDAGNIFYGQLVQFFSLQDDDTMLSLGYRVAPRFALKSLPARIEDYPPELAHT